ATEGQGTRSPWERHSFHVNTTAEGEEFNLPKDAVTYFVAGHLPLKQQEYRKRFRTLAATYITFSPDGSELLANLGGEQIYLFDVNRRRAATNYDLPFSSPPKSKDSANGYLNGTTSVSRNASVTTTAAPRVLPISGWQSSSLPCQKRGRHQAVSAGRPLKAQREQCFRQARTITHRPIALYNKAMCHIKRPGGRRPCCYEPLLPPRLKLRRGMATCTRRCVTARRRCDSTATTLRRTSGSRGVCTS
ncbi:PREDICTED: uncharacterized protein LOC106820210, partial [Priapulus caudatus]|uniref:Uncharacterized protein LOC106820210 n=1 Tax=Priapulus caudatus TaxID=37621 RepID=A0ABM1F713_PRICU